MKKILLILWICFFIKMNACFADTAPEFYTAAQQDRNVVVFSEKNKFGLKDKNGNIIAPAKYQKMIMTGKNGWIIQKRNKYGLMNSNGDYLVKPKYRFGDRILGRYTKLGNDNDFGIYNEFGEVIIPPIYSSIELLYGKMFLTRKNYRYGISDFKGNVLIPNICDEIYMPAKNTIKIKYMGSWYEISNVTSEDLKMPDTNVNTDYDNAIKDFIVETGAISGYSVLTFSDYFIKIFSSISPAHEETIDDLILSHGVDTVGILKKASWIPKYPVTFIKKYYARVRDPFNGLLADTRNKLINKR